MRIQILQPLNGSGKYSNIGTVSSCSAIFVRALDFGPFCVFLLFAVMKPSRAMSRRTLNHRHTNAVAVDNITESSVQIRFDSEPNVNQLPGRTKHHLRCIVYSGIGTRTVFKFHIMPHVVQDMVQSHEKIIRVYAL